MEEILASIRRIIADDQALPRPQRPVSTDPSPLEMHRPAAAPVKLAHSAKMPEPDPHDYDHPDEVLHQADDTDHLTESDPSEVLAQAEMPQEAVSDALISPAASESVSSAFETLATSMIMQNTDMIEHAVRDMLRPMLKNWLDDNLPTIVERLVRTEIERVARGRRS
jgi:cell pole-organizing protein PopZ